MSMNHRRLAAVPGRKSRARPGTTGPKIYTIYTPRWRSCQTSPGSPHAFRISGLLGPQAEEARRGRVGVHRVGERYREVARRADSLNEPVSTSDASKSILPGPRAMPGPHSTRNLGFKDGTTCFTNLRPSMPQPAREDRDWASRMRDQ